jgi:hypothetical protein
MPKIKLHPSSCTAHLFSYESAENILLSAYLYSWPSIWMIEVQYVARKQKQCI